jgi:DNA repair protein RecO (recombination protein O)
MRVDLQTAYILHARPFRDSSLLVEIITADFGKVSLVAKGARKSKQGHMYLLQPFTPVLVSWLGKSSLKTLVAIEANGQKHALEDKYLYSALYANELLVYLLPKDDPLTDVIPLYQQLLHGLEQQFDLELCLRQFEFSLLGELGYGVDFYNEASSGEPIDAHSQYCFVPDQGFVLVLDGGSQSPNYKGQHLLAIAEGQFSNAATRRAAKDIARQAIAPHLNGQSIKSREFFTQ